jgi:hypothetical protein
MRIKQCSITMNLSGTGVPAGVSPQAKNCRLCRYTGRDAGATVDSIRPGGHRFRQVVSGIAGAIAAFSVRALTAGLVIALRA